MRASFPAVFVLAAVLPAQQEEAAEGPEAVALRLGHPDVAVRRAAVQTLLELRPDLAGLREKLGSVTAEPEVRPVSIAFGLERGLERALHVGPAGVAKIAVGLADADPLVRRRTIAQICSLRDGASDYRDEVLECLADPDADVRAAVARNVAQLGWNDGVRDAILRGLKDRAAVVRKAAAEALGADRGDKGIVAALRGAVQDPDLDVRAMVARSLGKCGQAGRAAASDIVASLRDREEKVRVAALDAVRSLELRDARAVAEVIRCLGENDRKVLEAALRAAMTMAEAAAAATGRVLELTRHERGEVRTQALSAAWKVAPDKRRGAVILRAVEMLGDPHGNVTSRARAHLLQLVRDSRTR